MKYGRRTRARTGPPNDPDLDRALDAMTAEELRSFVRGALEELDDEPRAVLMDSLMARAANSGWRPSGPSRRIVGEVEHFAEAARRVGSAEPDEVSGYLRQGTKAFLAGDQTTARAVFDALLPPIADGEIDLGQHEMVDEVLTVNERECAAQYLVSVYLTTPVEERAEALCEALERVQAVASLWRPIEEMERVATGLLPELDAFLTHWVTHLEREPPSDGGWDSGVAMPASASRRRGSAPRLWYACFVGSAPTAPQPPRWGRKPRRRSCAAPRRRVDSWRCFTS